MNWTSKHISRFLSLHLTINNVKVNALSKCNHWNQSLFSNLFCPLNTKPELACCFGLLLWGLNLPTTPLTHFPELPRAGKITSSKRMDGAATWCSFEIHFNFCQLKLTKMIHFRNIKKSHMVWEKKSSYWGEKKKEQCGILMNYKRINLNNWKSYEGSALPIIIFHCKIILEIPYVHNTKVTTDY